MVISASVDFVLVCCLSLISSSLFWCIVLAVLPTIAFLGWLKLLSLDILMTTMIVKFFCLVAMKDKIFVALCGSARQWNVGHIIWGIHAFSSCILLNYFLHCFNLHVLIDNHIVFMFHNLVRSSQQFLCLSQFQLCLIKLILELFRSFLLLFKS